MTEMQRDLDHFIGRIVRREIECDGSVRVRAKQFTEDVEVGQTVYMHHADGSLPLVVTEVEDGWVNAEVSLAWRLTPPDA